MDATDTAIQRISHKDFAEHVAAILKGDEPLPNTEVVDQGRFLATLASGGGCMVPEWGWSRLPAGDPSQTRKSWTQFFLRSEPNMSTRGSTTSGAGYAVRYDGGKGVVYDWALCRHKKADHPGANHSRGWHPGHCVLCGIDMTVDSGD